MNPLVEKAYALKAPELEIWSQDQTVTLATLLNIVITWVGIIAGVIAFFYLVIGAFMYLTAGGNEDGAKKGQQAIINAIIGLLIITLSWGILSAVINTLNRTS